MSSKVNIFSIVKDYVNTLRSNRTKRTSAADVALFILFPLAVALASYTISVNFSEEMLAGILTASSIFTGLLFNLLLLVYNLMSKLVDSIQSPACSDEQKQLNRVRNRMLQEFYCVVSYLILLSVCIIFLCIVGIYIYGEDSIYSVGLTSFLILFGTNFFLSMLMALKRTHVLLKEVHL